MFNFIRRIIAAYKLVKFDERHRDDAKKLATSLFGNETISEEEAMLLAKDEAPMPPRIVRGRRMITDSVKVGVSENE